MNSTKLPQSCQCGCYQESTQSMAFHKIVESKETGLVIYRYVPQAPDATHVKETDKENIFVVRNTKNVQITLENLTMAFDRSRMTCPRCLKIIEQAKSLAKNIIVSDRQDIVGVCDHCRVRGRLHNSCCRCKEAVDKFVSITIEERERRRERINRWLTQVRELLRNAVVNEEKERKLKSRARSELSIDEVFSNINKAERKYASEVRYKSRLETSFRTEGRRPSTSMSHDSSEKFTKYPEKTRVAVDGKASRHKPKQSIFKIPEEIQRTDQILSEELLKVTSSFVKPFEDYDEKSKQKSKKPGILKSQKDNKVGAEDTIIKTSLSSEGVLIHRKEKRQSVLPPPPWIRHSKEHISKTAGEQNLSEVFTFSFPKEEKEVLKHHVSSSELIKDTQDMLKAKAEEDIKKKEEEKIKKKEEEDIKRKEKEDIKKKKEEEIRKKEEELKRKVSMKEEPEQKYEKPGILESQTDNKVDAKDNIVKPSLSAKGVLVPAKEKRRSSLAPPPRIHPSKEHISTEASERKKEALKHGVGSSENMRDMLKTKTKEDIKKTELELKGKVPVKEEPKKIVDASDVPKQGAKEAELKGKVPVKEEPKQIVDASDVSKQGKKDDKKSDAGAQQLFKQMLTQQAKEKAENEKIKREQEKAENLANQKAAEAEKLTKAKPAAAATLKEVELEKKVPVKEEPKKMAEASDVSKIGKKDDTKNDAAAQQLFKQMLAQQAKEKAEDERMKKEREKAENLAKQKAAEIGKLTKAKEDASAKAAAAANLKKLKEAEDPIPVPEESLRKKPETPTTKELSLKEIKMKRTSPDDLIFQLVKLKRTENVTRIPVLETKIVPIIVQKHALHSGPISSCPECMESDLTSDYDDQKPESVSDIIIGEKIFKHKGPRKKPPEMIPTLEYKELEERKNLNISQDTEQKKELSPPGLSLTKSTKTKSEGIEPPETGKGIIRYTLSDRTFIDKGWTMLPTEKVVRKMNVYRMRPAHPEFDWFEHNKYKRIMKYDSGETLAEFDDNGRGQWFYRSGKLALDYYDAEETNAGQRFVVYSSGEPDARGRIRPRTILASFDYLGNGIVFDHTGKIRLKYNQTEGIVLDREIGPVSHWKWHTLNDPPVLQQVMIDTQMPYKDPKILKLGESGTEKSRPDNEEMLAIEFDNFIKEKSKKLTQKFKPFQIKMKALKINEYFSLRVLDQATVYLLYRDGTTNLKINIGMILDHKEIVDTDTAEVGEVSNSLERLPARTDSLAGLQQAVAQAQQAERARVRHERRLKRPQPCPSVDRLRAGLSRPLRPPLLTASTSEIQSSKPCPYRLRKPPSSSLYYDNRF